jgi:hypothetical protein
MKKFTRVFLATAIMTGLPISAIAGNGAPSGSHYNLNIIGVQKGKTASMSGSNGHVIFANLVGNTKIGLAEGPDFKVLDANGTDGGAKFQMPSPDPDGDGVTVYSVYVRALGKPGGSAKMTACAIDPLTLEEVCSLSSVSVKRSAGKQSFSNVSKELLYVQIDIDGDGDIDSIPLFDDRLQDYLWSYDNSGLKLLQMRFYPQATNTN